MRNFDSGLLRLLWNLVDLHAPLLRSLNDDAIVLWLRNTIKHRAHITEEDDVALQAYLMQRSCLIRDMVEPHAYP